MTTMSPKRSRTDADLGEARKERRSYHIFSAIRADDLDAVKSSRDNPATGNEYGTTPLTLAVALGRTLIVRYLVDKVDVNAPSGRGFTPLMVAVMCGRAPIVAILLSQEDIDLTLRDVRGKSLIELANERLSLVQTSRGRRNCHAIMMLLYDYFCDESLILNDLLW